MAVYFIRYKNTKPFKITYYSNRNNTDNLIIEYDNNIATGKLPEWLLFRKYKVNYVLAGLDYETNKDGNNIIVHLDGDKYLYIGGEIYEFTTKDIILEFYSPLYEKNQPYSFAIGEDYIYLFNLDNPIYLPMSLFKYLNRNNNAFWPYIFYHENKKYIKSEYIQILSSILVKRRFDEDDII